MAPERISSAAGEPNKSGGAAAAIRWQLAFATTIAARDLVQIAAGIATAKQRFGLPAEGPVLGGAKV